METRTYQVYKWNELSEEAKQKALERYRYFNVEDDFWFDYDGKTGFSKKEIAKYHLELEHSSDLLEYKKLYFDIDRGWYIQFVDCEFAHEETARKFLRVPKALWERVYWTFINYRENTTRLEYESQDEHEFTSKQIQILDRAVEQFASKMHEALHDLQKTWEYQVSDEAIIESFEINDYDFTDDGRID